MMYTILLLSFLIGFISGLYLFKEDFHKISNKPDKAKTKIHLTEEELKYFNEITLKNELNDDIQFVENISDLKLVKINIDFINSNFGVNYLINKVNLYQLLTEQNILCRLTAKHSCLNIKHKISSDIYISIFVFQTGSIIITGAKTAENIRDAYIFIVKFLNKHKSKIIKRDISKILSVEEFEEILKLE